MSDDDDWFERALRESESDESEAPNGEESSESEAPNGEESGESEADEEATEDVETEESGSVEDAEPDPFEQDFQSAFENAPEPGGAGEFGGGGGGEEFGGGDGEEFDFGGGGDGEEFDFGGGGDGEEFGFGGGGGEEFGFGGDPGGTADFDEEEFESDIDRITVGIEGLDEMILGGVPKRSLMAVIGSAGTGKTTFGLQFLHEALSNDDRAVYITLEESRSRIVDTADEKGWQFSEYIDDEMLAVVDLDPVEMANSLASIRNDLPRLVDDFGAERLVLDSVSLLEMMYDHPSRRRSEVFEFTRSLKEAGVTTMVTSEAAEDSAYASRYGIIEYLADAVFVLQYVRPSDFRETRLAVEIQKIRDANHSRETKPYEITNEGISVYRQANIF